MARKHNSPKRLSGLHIAAFASAMAMVCGGCRGNPAQINNSVEDKLETPEAHSYVYEKMAATSIIVPQNLRENATAAQTYVYMARSAAAVGLCTDERNFEAGDAAQRARNAQRAKNGMLGQEIVEYITDLPTDNVDPVAVRAMTMLSDNFDTMDAYNGAVENVKIDTGTKWAGVFFGLLNGASSTDDVDFNKMTDKITGNVDLDDVTAIKSAASGYSKMQRLAHQTNDGLTAAQKELSVKYRGDFPKMPLNTNYTSRCDLPWFF